jgi:hypothetical protein
VIDDISFRPSWIPDYNAHDPKWKAFAARHDKPAPEPDKKPKKRPKRVADAPATKGGYPRPASEDADEWIACPGVEDPDAFAARIHGDSMAPKYRQGDIVIFSPAAAVRAGDDCFVRFDDGQTTFKQVYFERNAAGREVIRLQPRNDRYRPQVLPRERIAGVYRAMYRYQRVSEGGPA